MEEWGAGFEEHFGDVFPAVGWNNRRFLAGYFENERMGE